MEGSNSKVLIEILSEWLANKNECVDVGRSGERVDALNQLQNLVKEFEESGQLEVADVIRRKFNIEKEIGKKNLEWSIPNEPNNYFERELIPLGASEALGEEAFLNNLGLINNPILISGVTGAGLTTFLSHMARQIEIRYPVKKSIFLNAGDLFSLLKGLKKQEIFDVLQNLCAQKEMKNLRESEPVQIELFLDNWELIGEEAKECGISILRKIMENTSVRVWIAVYPHSARELVNGLENSGCYRLASLKEEDQAKFLAGLARESRCVAEGESEDDIELARDYLCYIRWCSKYASQDEREFTGIPGNILAISKLYNLKEDHGKGHVNKYAAILGEIVNNKLQKCSTSPLVQDKLLRLHARVSFQQLYPREFEIWSHLFPPLGSCEELLKFGLVTREDSESSPLSFIHNGFQQYFMGWFVTEAFGEEDMDLAGFINKSIFKSEYLEDEDFDCEQDYSFETNKFERFTNEVICASINLFVGMKGDTFHASDRASFVFKSLKFGRQAELASACAFNDFLHLYKLLNKSKSFSKIERFILFVHSPLEQAIPVGIQKASLPFVTYAIEALEKLSGHPHSRQEDLEKAVFRGHYGIFKYLLNHNEDYRDIACKNGETLLHKLVQNSTENSNKKIQEKLKILLELVQMDKSILESSDVLISDEIHKEILFKLVELGANLLAFDEEAGSIFRQDWVGELTPEKFHQILLRIPQDKLVSLCANVYSCDSDSEVDSDGSTKSSGSEKKKVEKEKEDVITLMFTFLINNDPLPATFEIFKKAGANPNAKDGNGTRVLELCIRRGRSLSTFQAFIEMGANWKEIDSVHLAARYGQLEIVKFLVGLGADINLLDKDGLTPLDEVIKSDGYGERLETGKYLYDNGGQFNDDLKDNGRNLLHFAAKDCNAESAKLLLYMGLGINSRDVEGNTPLHLALAKCRYSWNADMINILFDGGANPNLLNKKGETPLVFGLRMKLDDLECIMKVLRKTRVTWTPEVAGLFFKEFFSQTTDDEKILFEIMEEVGRVVDYKSFKDGDGSSFLHFAVDCKNLKAVEILLEQGLNPNQMNNLLRTPLHLACYLDGSKSFQISRMLVEKGASLRLGDCQAKEQSVLHIAAKMGNLELTKYFLEKGIDVGRTDRAWNTALHTVLLEGKKNVFEIVKLFLEQEGGKESNRVRNNDGKIPLEIAHERKLGKKITDILENKAME